MVSKTPSLNAFAQTPPLPSEVEIERKALNDYLERNPNFNDRLNDFITRLKRKDHTGTLHVAKETLDLIHKFIASNKRAWENPYLMLVCLRGLGRRLIAASPLTLVVGCMVRRVLYLLRDEISRQLLAEKEKLTAAKRKGKSGGAAATNAASSSTRTGNAKIGDTTRGGVEEEEENDDDDDNDGNDNEDEEDGVQDGKKTSEENEDDGGNRQKTTSKTITSKGTTTTGSKSTKKGNHHLPTALPPLSSLVSSANTTTIMPSLGAILADEEDLVLSLADEAGGGGEGAKDSGRWRHLKRTMVQQILELTGELDNINDPIAKHAIDFIHSREVVLVYGLSRCVEAFLISARNYGPNFEVFVAETPNGYRGHAMALQLASHGVDTTVVTDAALFALMSRVNKVLIGAQAIMANGGVIADCGTNMVATAAKHHSVPLLCVTGLYKLCPLYPFSQDSFNELTSPGNVVPYGEAPTGGVDVISPQFDYVPPEKVTVFITDTGVHQPAYVYRLLAEYYSPLDKLVEGVPALDS